MPFKDPTTTLPADAIEGQIGSDQIEDGAVTFDKIAVDALNGRIITGTTLQTAAAGKRVVLASPEGTIRLYSGLAGETPGIVESDITTDDGGEMRLGYLSLKPPTTGSRTPPEILLVVGPVGEQQYRIGPLLMVEQGSDASASVVGRFTVTGAAEVFGTLTTAQLMVNGHSELRHLTAGNFKSGRVTITAGGGTPTSATVTGLGLTGTGHRAVATPSTTVPGTTVTGVGCTSVTADSMIVWITRAGTATGTGVDYIVMGA
ncbi:hypothetical protein [Streptomyces sp. NPDC048157]|uniref:hypothetical protein n=1 Tax=Streptomyces sp. NPDC048157 TaxID=3365503 RepID=UPI00371ADD39